MNAEPPSGKIAVLGLGGSALALALAPLVLDSSYSWLKHTTSEAGAQGVDGAWLARTGFVLFGVSVLWVTFLARRRWGQPAVAFHLAFGLSMFCVAGFSIRPWIANLPFDSTEDSLHSVFATIIGFAFAFGVASVAARLAMAGHRFRALDLVAMAASIVVPVVMGVFDDIDGGLQRLMFGVAYIWYIREALILEPTSDSAQ